MFGVGRGREDIEVFFFSGVFGMFEELERGFRFIFGYKGGFDRGF